MESSAEVVSATVSGVPVGRSPASAAGMMLVTASMMRARSACSRTRKVLSAITVGTGRQLRRMSPPGSTTRSIVRLVWSTPTMLVAGMNVGRSPGTSTTIPAAPSCIF